MKTTQDAAPSGEETMMPKDETKTSAPAGCKCRGHGCCACKSPIPDGGTCASACAHVERCTTLFGQDADDTCCQWIPSRFLARKPATTGGAT